MDCFVIIVFIDIIIIKLFLFICWLSSTKSALTEKNNVRTNTNQQIKHYLDTNMLSSCPCRHKTRIRTQDKSEQW